MTRAALSPAAERDILAIIEWIAAENPVAARGFHMALDRLASTIGEHPLIGALKPHLASPPTRFLPIRGYPPQSLSRVEPSLDYTSGCGRGEPPHRQLNGASRNAMKDTSPTSVTSVAPA